MGDLPAYLILGHGTETPIPYETRDVLPANTYLVTMTECGISSQSQKHVFPLLDAMLRNNPSIFSDPVRHKDLIESLINNGIRISVPGDPYPALHLDLLVDATVKSGQVLLKSGVYKLPITERNFHIRETFEKPGQVHYSTPVHFISWQGTFDSRDGAFEKAYRGSILPEGILNTRFVKGDLFGSQEIKALTQMTLKDILTRLGEGVYYFPVCRDIKSPELEDGESLLSYLWAKAEPQIYCVV